MLDSGYYLTFYTLVTVPLKIQFIGFSLHYQGYICSHKFMDVFGNHGETRW